MKPRVLVFCLFLFMPSLAAAASPCGPKLFGVLGPVFRLGFGYVPACRLAPPVGRAWGSTVARLEAELRESSVCAPEDCSGDCRNCPLLQKVMYLRKKIREAKVLKLKAASQKSQTESV